MCGFVFLGCATQALAGFGSTVIALTLGALVAPIDLLVPLIVAVGLLQTTVLLARHYKEVDGRLLVLWVLPLMGLGAVAAQPVRLRLQGPGLEVLYGAFVVLVAARQVWKATRTAAEVAEPPLPRPTAALTTLGAGLIHGIYASGGPLLVYALAREGLSKAAFRSTLIAVWFLLNTSLLIWFVHQGRLTTAHVGSIAWLAPGAILGLFAGEWGHDRVDEGRFRLVVNLLLILAGAALLVPALGRAFGSGAAVG